ncbi:MAG TPA: hypothetical protein VK936_01765, partial [Longimicrobiales bacterium]|nr:hypothetical protein [Longimicrobiales bacterium]
MTRAGIAPLLTSTAACILALPFFLLLVTSLLLAAGVALTWIVLPVALVPWAAFAAWTSSAPHAVRPRTRFVIALAATGVTLAVACIAEAFVYDSSWDGQAYHALAIDGIANGWNPVRDPTPAVPAYANELTFFAKGPWLLAAGV